MVFHPPVAIIAKAGDAGKYKVGLPAWNMVLRGVLSGAFIAMGGALATVCSTGILASDAAMRFGVASPGFAQLILGAVFPVGLIITVLTGAELFTGDAMLAPMAAFVHKVSWASVFNLWIWVYIGNFIGSILFAYIMAYGPCITVTPATGAVALTAFGERAIAIALAKTSYGSFLAGGMATWSLFLKAIACNWLVNLAVLLGICADDAIGKIAGIWFPIFAFVASGFEHSVANMYFISTGIFCTDIAGAVNSLSWVGLWTDNVIVATLGNIVGGLFFVSVLYWVAFRKEIAALK